MYEFMRRIKLQLKRLLEAGSLTSVQNTDEESKPMGPGGCRISLAKIRRELPQISLDCLEPASLIDFLKKDVDP